MFKSWRNDKNKIKAVFKLQFQCNQVPKLKKSAVMISLVPDDVGKPTFKLEKVPVENGTCLWENPIYVTVKLIREPKTGYIKEKIYHFIVSTGSSKSGFLGEASIDFADFATETEPLTLLLPLKFANSGAVLHVTIEKMDGATDQRYIEENEDKDQQSKYNTQDQNFAEDALESCWDGNSDQNNQEDPANLQSPLRQNSVPQQGTVDATKTHNHAHRRSNTDWSVGSISDGSLAESTNSPDDNLGSDGSVEKLKNEIAVMMRQVELSELELQSLRKQVAKESKRAQDQTRQIISLSNERDALTIECEQLRKQNSIDIAEIERRLQSEEHLKVLQEEIREELNYEKEVSAHLRLQLEKTQDSNAELILAVKDLNEMLEQKNMEISSLTSKLEESKLVREDQLALEALAKERNKDKEVDMLKQKIRDQGDEIHFFKKHAEDLEIYIKQLTEDCQVLKEENQCLTSKLEKIQQQESMKSRECIESLATIKELESQVERLEDKIKQQSEEYSESLISINELECKVKELKRELDKQAQEFEDDIDAVTHAKTEQEQRAIRAEEELRKTRWKNTVTAERLQDEFRRLSVDMASKLDENEKLAMKAMTEANELRMQKAHLEEMLQKANDELSLIKDQNGVKLQELSDQLEQKDKQIQKMYLELDHSSSQLIDAHKSEAQKHEALSSEIHMLRTEIEKLRKEQYNLSKHGKQRDDNKPKVLTGETDERDDLEKKFASAKQEAAKAHEELISMRSLKGENEMLIGNLQAEVENLKVQQNKLQNSLIEEKLEKDNLAKQVFQLKDELQKKKEEINRTGKGLKKYGGPVSDAQMTSMKERLRKGQKKLNKAELETSDNRIAVDEYRHMIRKGETCSEKGVTALASHSSDEGNFTEVLMEVSLLKENNKRMETELKEMQERYSEISLKFAEVEGERQQLVMTVRNLKNGKRN